MPLYDYECSSCQYTKLELFPISTPNEIDCPLCEAHCSYVKTYKGCQLSLDNAATIMGGVVTTNYHSSGAWSSGISWL